MRTKFQMVHINLPVKLYKQIKKEAAQFGLTLTGYVRLKLLRSKPLNKIVKQN